MRSQQNLIISQALSLSPLARETRDNYIRIVRALGVGEQRLLLERHTDNQRALELAKRVAALAALIALLILAGAYMVIQR